MVSELTELVAETINVMIYEHFLQFILPFSLQTLFKNFFIIRHNCKF